MSISLALNNSISGLNAAQAALSIASQNVANSGTEGYSRKITNQSALVIAGIPNGVQVDLVTRLTNDFLNNEFRTAKTELTRSQAITDFFELAQNLFGSPGSNSTFTDDFAELVSSFEALANNPENAGLRFDVVASAVGLADTVATVADGIQALRFSADQELSTTADRINGFLVEVDELNVEIKRLSTSGVATGDLEDQRDLAVRNIAAEIDINTFTRSDGRIAVLTRRGQTLVDDTAQKIVYTPAATVNANTVFAEMRIFSLDGGGQLSGNGELLITSGNSASVTSTIESGRLAGLLEMRDNELRDMADALEAFSNAVRDEVNSTHNLGSSFPPPTTLTGTRAVAGGDAFQGTGTVRIAVTDATGSIVDVQDLDLTALGATTVGALITNINAALAGNATAAIVNGVLEITADNAANGVAINAAGTSESATSENFSHYFGFNDIFTDATAANLEVRASLRNDPGLIAAGQLSTTAAVGATGIAIGDNRTAQALAELGTKAVAFTAVGGVPAMTTAIGDFGGAFLGLNAARSAAATDSLVQREFVLENIENRFISDTGVNLDEELANMVLFQNAFAMSARMLSIASEMFDTLVNLDA